MAEGEGGVYLDLYVRFQNIMKEMKALQDQINKADLTVPVKITASEGVEGTKTNKAQGDKEASDREYGDKHREMVKNALTRISDVGVGFIQKTFGMVEQLYATLKKHSPLLQAVEQLFNLAWMLFFMPIGNKLAETLIPAVLQMVDDVMEIWDAFEGMSLGEMLEYAIETGAEMLGEFLLNIGEELAEQGGLVGSIGNMLVTMGDFIKNHGAQLINLLTKFMEFILDHLKELIAVVIAFKAITVALQIRQIIASYMSAFGGLNILGVIGALTPLALVGLAAGGVAYGVMAGAFAEGGHVDATPGGHLAVVGEGGEGEWIIPDSKMSSIGGNNTYTINNYMMSTDELDRHIREVVSGEVSAARLRSGY